MTESQKSRALNPWLLHLQKLSLELKCPLCLNLFNRPVLLPCDHMFCNACIPRCEQYGLTCPVCKSVCCNVSDLRPLPFIENFVKIYKGLNACSGVTLQSVSSEVNVRTLESGNKFVQVVTNQTEDGRSKRSELINRTKNAPDSNHNPHLSHPSCQTHAGGNQHVRAMLSGMNGVEQPSPRSPPSFGDIKGSDNDSSDQGGEHPLEGHAAGSQIKRNLHFRQEQNDSSASETEGQLRDFKRHKKLEYGPGEDCVRNIIHNQLNLPMESSFAPESVLISGTARAGAVTENHYTCGFCQSSRITEVTGPMSHYVNGRQVVGDVAANSNVIHVHSKCVDWAPQAYYVGETIKNLKSELLRGAKLKCTRCGLKGAALGCYEKSCRKSYHLPCAVEISKCRWDLENFLVLCPTHSSTKFPNEKCGKEISANHVQSPLLPVPTAQPLPTNNKGFVLCGSALSSEEKFLLVQFGNKIGARVSKFWRPDVTHVIAATDAEGACTRTLKVLMAIVNGSWVLNVNWIKACMEASRLINEEPYEVSLDTHGCKDGPKTGRLRALNKEPKLFDGLSFYFNGDFMAGYKEDLQSLVVTAGGTVLKSKDELMVRSSDDKAASKILVVYNMDSPEGSKIGEEISMIWDRLSEAEDLATRMGSQVIGHTWLLQSIAGHQLLPFIS